MPWTCRSRPSSASRSSCGPIAPDQSAIQTLRWLSANASRSAFTAAIQHAGTAGVTLAVIGVLCSAVTAYVYFRVILLMFFSENDQEQAVVALPSSLTQAAIALGVIITIVLGVFPSPILSTLGDAALFLR